jgi:hypothetical protein
VNENKIIYFFSAEICYLAGSDIPDIWTLEIRISKFSGMIVCSFLDVSSFDFVQASFTESVRGPEI